MIGTVVHVDVAMGLFSAFMNAGNFWVFRLTGAGKVTTGDSVDCPGGIADDVSLLNESTRTAVTARVIARGVLSQDIRKYMPLSDKE